MSIFWHNRYSGVTQPVPAVTVIIAAAGDGERMGKIPKPLCELRGKKAIVYALEVFEQSDFVKQIAVSVKREYLEQIAALIGECGISKVVCVTEGGGTRQESVAKAFTQVFKRKSDITPFVAVHDAARPLITVEQFDEAVKTACRYGSAVCAVRANDSVRRADRAGFITEIVERENLWHIQTPQIFDTDLFHTALSVAKKDHVTAADESALVLRAGFRVKLFECGYENIKLTYPEDLKIAEALLAAREGEG